MINLTVGEDKHWIKNEFIDVKLSELSEAYKLLHRQDKTIQDFVLEDKMPDDEHKLIEFKIKWVAMFCSLSEEQLRLVPLKIYHDSVSLDWLYSLTEKFFRIPDSALDLKSFRFKGKKYELIKPLTTISGAKMLLGSSNFRMFMLSSQLSQMVEENKSSERCIDNLRQLVAVVYSDGNDDTDSMRKRANDFKDLNALFAWSAYFFFALLVTKYKEFFHLYTKGKLTKEMKKVMSLERLDSGLSKTRIGRYVQSKLPKRECLILQT